MRVAMLRLLIAAAFFCLVAGFLVGYGVRAAFWPAVQVHTQQFDVTTQQIHLDKLYCHVSATLVDPAVRYTFTQDIVCSATPEGKP